MSLSARRKKIRIIARQTKSFTLVEVLLSVGILVVLVSMVVVGLGAYKGRTAFDLDANQIVAVLRNAQSRAVSQDRGQGWGVQFTNSTTTGSQYALFWGTSYTTSSVVVAGTLGYSSVFTDPAPGFSKTIVFNPVTGASVGPDVVVIKNTTSNNVAIITVSALGLVGETTESGLAGYWPLDEGAGTSAYDASKNGTTGNFGNTPTWGGASCKAGSCLLFSNAAGNYVDAGISGGKLLSQGPFSISFWFNASGTMLPLQGLISKDQSSPYIFSIRRQATGNNLEITMSGHNLDTTLAPVPGVWYNLVFTMDGSGRKVYVNGGNDGTPTVSDSYAVYPPDNGDHLYIGLDYIPGSGRSFSGFIDDVRIYSRVLSATEIKNLFSAY